MKSTGRMRGSLRQHQNNCKDGAAGTQQRNPPKTRVCQKFFCQQPDSGQHVRKKLNFKQDIDVRGMRGDEALQAVTYFVDDAILVGMSRVRILHGTGTGILRTLIRQYLQTIPGSPPFCRRTYPIGRCRYHGSRFGIKKKNMKK